jgi:hypothetical protein
MGDRRRWDWVARTGSQYAAVIARGLTVDCVNTAVFLKIRRILIRVGTSLSIWRHPIPTDLFCPCLALLTWRRMGKSPGQGVSRAAIPACRNALSFS